MSEKLRIAANEALAAKRREAYERERLERRRVALLGELPERNRDCHERLQRVQARYLPKGATIKTPLIVLPDTELGNGAHIAACINLQRIKHRQGDAKLYNIEDASVSWYIVPADCLQKVQRNPFGHVSSYLDPPAYLTPIGRVKLYRIGGNPAHDQLTEDTQQFSSSRRFDPLAAIARVRYFREAGARIAQAEDMTTQIEAALSLKNQALNPGLMRHIDALQQRQAAG